MGCDKPIKTFIQNSTFGETEVSLISLNSKEMVSDLAKYGITSNKSRNPTIRRLEHNRDFWRGVIDADGTLNISGDGRTFLELVGTQTVCNQFLQFAKLHNPLCTARVNKHKNVIYSARLCARFATRTAYILYNDSSTYLDRKYENFLRIMGQNSEDLYTLPLCKHCSSNVVVKSGMSAEGNQRYLCRTCGRKFNHEK